MAALPACPGGGPCVVVRVLGAQNVVQDERVIPAADIAGPAADIKEQTSYPLFGGSTVDVPAGRGTTLRQIVSDVVGDDLSVVTFAEVVENGAYGRHLLSSQELKQAGDNGFQGNLAPTFYTFGSAPTVINYIRPLRGAGDPNSEPGPELGYFSSEVGGSLLILVHKTGQPLSVTVDANATDSTERAYSLSADPSREGDTYHWVFPEGGGTSTAATPTYTFPDGSVAGDYPVDVAVQADDGSFGWGETLLHAGPAPTPAATPSPTPGTGGNGSGDNGPQHNPSGHPTGSPNPQQSPGNGGQSTDPTGDPSATEAPPTLPPLETQSPESQPSPPTPTPTPTPTEEPTPTPAAPTGDEVSGIVLSAADVVGAAPQVSSDAPSPSPAARPISDAPWRISSGVLVVVGLLLLLLAGAASESPRTRAWLAARLRPDQPSVKMGP